MKIGVFSLHDVKANIFAQPFYSANPDTAKRAFANALMEGKGDMVKFPEDFNLWHLGWFDDDAGTFEEFQPEQLATAAQILGGRNAS